MQEYMSLAEVVDRLPRSTRGKKQHISTVFRWCTSGVRGVRLEHIRLGKRIMITPEALERFGQAVADAALTPQESPRPKATRTAAQRAKALEAARAVVER